MDAQTVSKVCSRCGAEKPLDQYHRAKDCKLGVRAHCKACACAYANDYHHSNRAAVLERQRLRRAADPDGARQYHRDYYASNTERRREYFRKWRDANRERYLESAARSYRKASLDPKRRLEAAIRTGVHKRLSGERKSARTFHLLGYTADDLKTHLERQFTKGMTWENFGEWHVDHILPLSGFSYETPDDPGFASAWALTNLRPLWGRQNVAKGAKRLTLL